MMLRRRLSTLVWLCLAVLLLAQPVWAQPVLVPGPGFSGPTPQPDQIGRPARPGRDCKVIGHFDIVPFQTFSGNLNIGVVAFHMNGIDRVEFSANGGPWASVTQMTLNPQTNVVEYWAVLRAIDLADGPVEVRARAYPKYAGIPRVISYNYEFNNNFTPLEVYGVKLYANAGGTLPAAVRYVAPGGTGNGLSAGSPMGSISAAASAIQSAQGGDAGGGTIYLANGSYSLPSLAGISAPNRWLTIAGAPGTSPNNVVFNAINSNGLTNGLLHVRGVRVNGPDQEFGGSGGGLWLKDYTYAGASHTGDDGGVSATSLNQPKGIFLTESSISYARMPITRVTLARNLVLDHIGEDLLRDPRTCINIVSTNHGGVPHADFTHWAMWVPNHEENFILYNIKNHDCGPLVQGIYFHGWGQNGPAFDNAAFVNIHIDKANVDSTIGQWIQTPSDHVLMWHITYANLDMRFGDSISTLTNFSIRGCTWWGVANYSLPSSAFHDCHFEYAPSAEGSNYTTGSPMFTNPAANNFKPAPGSPLRNRINPLLSPIDVMGVARNAPASVGAFEP